MARRYLTRCTAAKLASWFGVDTDTAQRILDYQPRSFAILTSNMLLTPAQVERITDSSHVYVFFGADTRSQEITRDDDSHPNSHDSTTVGHNIDVGHKSGVVGHNSDTVSHDSDTVSHDSDTVGHDSGASGHDSGVVGHKSDDARGRDTQVEQGDSSHTHCVKPLSADSLQAKYAEVVDNSPTNCAVAPEKCDRHLDCKDANLPGSETEDKYTSEHIAQRGMPKCVKTLYGESEAHEGGAAESLTMQHRGSDFVASAKGNSPQFLWDDNFDPYHQANLLDRFNAFEANQARINKNTEKCMRASSATLARLSETMDAMDRRSFTITAAMTKQSDMISSSLAEKSEQALVDLANKSDYTLVSLEARASTALDAIAEKSERAFAALQCTTKSAIADLNTNMHKMMQVFSAFSANQANECQKDASTSSDSQETDSVCLTADNLETYAKGEKPPTGQNVHISKDLGENFSTSQQTAAVKAPKGAQVSVSGSEERISLEAGSDDDFTPRTQGRVDYIQALKQAKQAKENKCANVSAAPQNTRPPPGFSSIPPTGRNTTNSLAMADNKKQVSDQYMPQAYNSSIPQEYYSTGNMPLEYGRGAGGPDRRVRNVPQTSVMRNDHVLPAPEYISPTGDFIQAAHSMPLHKTSHMRQVSQGIPANDMPLACDITAQEYNSIPADHHLLRANNAQAMPQANAAMRGSNFGRVQPDIDSLQRRLQNLPRFDGRTNWEDFIQVFEGRVGRLELPDAARLDLLEGQLTDQALKYHGRLLKQGINSYGELRTQLAKRYAERNTSSIRRSELQAATQSALESITDFGERIAFLASEGYPDIPPHNRNEIEVEAFLRGCYDQENVKWVLHGTHVTLDDAIDGMLKAQRNAKTLATTQSLKAVRAVQGKSVQFKDEKEDNAIGMSDVLSSIKSLQEHVERMSACEGTFKVYASPASQRRTSNTYERQSRSPSPVRSGAYSSRDFNRNPRSYGDFDRSPHRYTSENPNRNFQNRSVNRDFERSPQRTHYENFNRNSRMQNYDSNRKHSPVHRQSRFSSDKNNNRENHRFRSPRQGHDNRSYSGHDNRSNSGHRHRLDSDSRTPAQAGGYRNSPRSDNSHRERNFRSGGDRPNRSYTPKFSERRTRRVLSEERYSDDHTPGEEVLDYSVPDNMSDDDSLTSLESLNP